MRTSRGGRTAGSAIPCPRCGYDLRGNVRARQCPECGTPIDRDSPTWRELDVHQVCETGGLDRLSPCLKGSILVVGGFLTLGTLVAVAAAVCMLMVSIARIALTVRFLRGPIAPRSIRPGFLAFVCSDCVGILLGGGMLATIELGPADLRAVFWTTGSVTWMSTATLGLLAIGLTCGRRLLRDGSRFPGLVGCVATIAVGSIGLGLTILVTIDAFTSWISGWHPAILAAGWVLATLALGAGFLGMRFAMDQVTEDLISDFVDDRVGSRPDLAAGPGSSDAKALPPIPLEGR